MRASAGIDRGAGARGARRPLPSSPGADFLADGLKSIRTGRFPLSPPDIRLAKPRRLGGSSSRRHFPLPADKARFVGEAVAMVVARSVQAAEGRSGARAQNRLRAAPAETNARARRTLALGAPRVWDEEGIQRLHRR